MHRTAWHARCTTDCMALINDYPAGSTSDYSQSIGESMDETLIMMAVAGGDEAAREITRLLPLWQPPQPVRTPIFCTSSAQSPAPGSTTALTAR